MFKQIMNVEDAQLAKFAEVFVTINNKRYPVLMCKDFEGTANVSTQEVPRMGAVVMGHRATGVEISFKMTIYKCTEIFDDLIEQFINTGYMPTFEIQTTNEDPATPNIGRSTKIYNDCILDGDVLMSLTGSEDDYIEQEISGYAGSITRPEKYNNPTYMG